MGGPNSMFRHLRGGSAAPRRTVARSRGARRGVYTFRVMERAYSPCSFVVSTVPGALPQADMVRAFGALVSTSRWEPTIAQIGASVRSLRWGLPIGTISRGPEARSIPAWRNAPGMETTMLLRWAEGPTHPNGETVWKEFDAFIGMMSHIRCLYCMNSSARFGEAHPLHQQPPNQEWPQYCVAPQQ